MIVDVNNGKREREIRLKELDEVLNPTWSADGNRIAFSGLVGGLTDLFVYDLSAGALKRLTNDAFAELDPAWARRLAHRVCDRSLHDQPREPPVGTPPHRGHGCRVRRGAQRGRLRGGEEHQPAVDA